MGVWERSPRGAQIASELPQLLAEYRQALPDFTPADVAGSPYAVRRYVVDEHLGGPEGLAGARRELANRGLGLILDFVPNHVARDHPWTSAHPEYFIHDGDSEIACGCDPYFPPWTDTAQVNIFQPGARAAMTETMRGIAAQCDGVRCDMAMLLLNGVFQKTWGERAGARPASEFWAEAIPAVRSERPEFIFIAEAYWGLEPELQTLGFDYCYDKELYDALVRGPAEAVRRHLSAPVAQQRKLIRFLENHDESRAAAAFPADKERAAAVVVGTAPGAKLFHEGQFEGRKRKTPVQLGRAADEPPDSELRDFYWMLLQACRDPIFHDGDWDLIETSGWPDNQSHRNLLTWAWQCDAERAVIVVNYSAGAAQGRAHLHWDDLPGKTWRLADVLRSESYARSGDEMALEGLFVDLPAWGFHFLRFAGTV
jgi:glycosidase